jgi:hypothetical protein
MGGPPGGVPGGGGPPGGFPSRGFPGGGGPPAPVPLPPAPVVPGGRGDKLVGNPPLIFKGDRDKAEEFITQWQLYKGVNITNDLMRNTYQRAMLFLTYIQGPLVNEWVKGVNVLRSVGRSVRRGRWGVCPECRQESCGDLPCYIEASTTERCWDRGGRDAHRE